MPRVRGSSSSNSGHRGQRGRASRARTSIRGAKSSSRTTPKRQQTPSRHTTASRRTPTSSSQTHFSPRHNLGPAAYVAPSSVTLPPLPGDNNAQAQSSSEPIQHEIVMAIDMKDSSAMGCAFFSTTDGVLHVSEDISMARLDVAEQFLFHVEPTTVLISVRAPEEFQKHVETATIPSGMLLVKH